MPEPREAGLDKRNPVKVVTLEDKDMFDNQPDSFFKDRQGDTKLLGGRFTVGYMRNFFWIVVLPALLSLAFGYTSFYLLTRFTPNYYGRINDNRAHPWPKLPLTTCLGMLGSALSFLLVFSLNWSFQHWRSGRQLLGSTLVRLTELYLVLRTSGGNKAQENLRNKNLLLGFAAAVMLDVSNENDGKERSHWRKYVLYAHQRLGKKIAATKEANLSTTWGLHRELLGNHAAMKRIQGKAAESDQPPSIDCLVRGLLNLFTILIYPIFLAYLFVMELGNNEAKHNFLWRKTCIFHIAFIFSCLLPTLYFNILHFIARELEDPSGQDWSDIKLEPFFEKLCEDLKELDAVEDLEPTGEPEAIG